MKLRRIVSVLSVFCCCTIPIQIVFALDGPFNKNSASTISPDFSIPNSHVFQYSEKFKRPLFYRGSEPYKPTHFRSLQAQKIQQILIFKNERDTEVRIERNKLIALGWPDSEIIHIPMPWKIDESSPPACELIKTALVILERNYQTQKTTYIHCSVGEDRTSLIAALWKIWHDDPSEEDELAKVFQSEMCQYGYGKGALPSSKPPNIAEQIEQNLTPLYISIGQEILLLKKNSQSLENLNCSLSIKSNLGFQCQSNLNHDSIKPTKGESHE